jgi:hypothetical protein
MASQFLEGLLASRRIAVAPDDLGYKGEQVTALVPPVIPIFDDMGLLFRVVIVPGLAIV